MDLLTCFQVAFNALRINLLRSVLTMLGIIIGVAAVITMVGVGAGAQQEVDERINAIGANLLTVTANAGRRGGVTLGSETAPSLALGDVIYLKENIPEIEAASPRVSGRAQVIHGNMNWPTEIEGVNEDSLITGNWSLDEGREFFTREIETGAKVALIGQTIKNELFGAEDAIGQTVRINRIPVRVVGTLKAKGENGWGRDQDDLVMLPVKTVLNRIVGNTNRANPESIRQITITVQRGALMEQVEDDIRYLLGARHRVPATPGNNPFRVRNITEAMEARAETRSIFNTLLAAIASVSLLVGGIGIMNIMLVSVTERTREIGLRLAVGARERDIMRQFLVEAITLCVMGGLIGIGVSLLVSAVAASWSGWPIVIQPSVMFVSVLFSGVVGIFFGYYPARKASRMNPIEALHFE
ncbi:ABC transporter permease [Gilvimarinus sp. F26214L]|uniref:ABC transporter permease n=1 Tax=Gilvimarinus sp. DZF01 TaxID=3461371 RepID=UPI0040461299